MVTSLPVGITAEIIYPDRDGNPMSDNTKQFSWIVKIKENIELLCADDLYGKTRSLGQTKPKIERLGLKPRPKN